MRWINPTTRLAIYHRDGFACVYCGTGIEIEGTILSLDHVRPKSTGGGNGSCNLVTACHKCNTVRGDRPLKTWAEDVARYINHEVTSGQIINRVRFLTRQDLKSHKTETLKLIASRKES